MIRTFLLVVLVHTTVLELFAQGEYISRGQSAFGGDLFFSTNREANGYGVQIGYSHKGFLDAGLLWIKSNAGKAKDGIISPIITYYPVKQEDGEDAPTLGLSLGYRHYTTSEMKTFIVQDTPPRIDYTSYQIRESKTVDAIVVNVAAHRNLGYWSVFFFQPMLGAGISLGNPGVQFALQGGISIGTRMVKGPLLVFIPSIERESDLTTFILQFEAVF